MYDLDKVFDMCECGDNALDMVYALKNGNICCDYPFISFGVQSVNVNDGKGSKEMDSYEALKEWWINEN